MLIAGEVGPGPPLAGTEENGSWDGFEAREGNAQVREDKDVTDADIASWPQPRHIVDGAPS